MRNVISLKKKQASYPIYQFSRLGIFLQLLEGNKDFVLKLYAIMQKDSHRTNIITLIECEGNARIFDRWPMPYREISDMELKMVNHILFWIKIVNKSLEINNELILKNLSNLEEKLAA